MKTLPLAVYLFSALTAPAFAAITVNSPANGTQVTSPFPISANASTCSAEPVAAMGYSLDNSANTTIVNRNSISATISASVGAHTLHIKSWGPNNAACVANVAVNVVAPKSTTPPTAVTLTVSNPQNNASLTSPFALVATGGTCSGEPVAAMGYSLDNSSSTTIVSGASLSTSVTAAAGAHTLHVKSWGPNNAACAASVAIVVEPPQNSGPPAAGSITVSSPENNASVPSPFQLDADAATCSNQTVTAMGYSLDSSADTTILKSTSIAATVTLATGSHTVHVKAWGDAGAACENDVAVSVTDPGTAATVPPNAISVSSIQALSNWKESFDVATASTSGAASASGAMSLTGSPALSGNARQFVTSFANNGGERYYVSFGDDTSSMNFLYSVWVYIPGPSSELANLEMDMNQTMPNGETAIFGFQCDGWTGTWDYTENKGTPEQPVDTWLHSNQSCNARNWTTNTWHHVQVSYSRDESGNVTYKSVWLDDVEQQINATVPSGFALGWGPSLLTNLQVDGVGKTGSVTVYIDDLTIQRW
jgi:hypothetical protein